MGTKRAEFLFNLAEDLEKRARETEERVRDAYRFVQETSSPEFRRLSEELKGKAQQIWQMSYDAYQRAGERGAEQLNNEQLHIRLGKILLAMENWEEAFKEFEASRQSGKIINDAWRTAIVAEVSDQVCSAEGYQRVKAWLEDQRQQGLHAHDHAGWRDAQEALLTFVRRRYSNVVRNDSPQPSDARSSELPLLVTPIALEADAKLYPSGEHWEESHPLFERYIPMMRERIERDTGVRIPGIRCRPNESDHLIDSYLVLINEVPLATGTVDREKKFCPSYDEASFILDADDDRARSLSLRPAFNPLTGKEDGAWIGKDDLEEFQFSATPLWDYFEYIIHHLEQIVRENLSLFIGVQEVHLLLNLWQERADGIEAQERRGLIQRAMPDSAATLRFTQVLQGLVKEAVPITNLSAILQSFAHQSPKDQEIIRLIEAARQAVKDELPGNNGLYELLRLSRGFEEEVNRWLSHGEKLFFAIPPEETQELLSAFRSAVESKEQSRLGVVTTLTGIRPFVRRLIDFEFPRVTTLSMEELRPDLIEHFSGVIEYPTN